MNSTSSNQDAFITLPEDGRRTVASAGERYLRQTILNDLSQKMIFLGGPRQVGKTSLARSLLPNPDSEMNFDVVGQRERILKHELPDRDLWFFDEIHKYRGWRNYLKGLVDAMAQPQAIKRRILVTGSARLDLYRRGGDSLQGRYFHFRLHPWSVAELGGTRDAFDDLMVLGGFPEPLFRGSESFARRWRLTYRDRLIREELTSLEQVHDLAQLELLALALPQRVGSPLSLNALRNDIAVQHATLARWVDILEKLYAIFRIKPFSGTLRSRVSLRAVRKQLKHYHYDWGLVQDAAARFENLIASHLLKWVEFQYDSAGHAVELRYFRDVDGREVDFVVLHDGEPIAFVECKLSDADVSPALRYLHARFPQAVCWQLSATGTKDYVSQDGVRVTPAWKLLRQLT